jgi:hypothetical protein
MAATKKYQWQDTVAPLKVRTAAEERLYKATIALEKKRQKDNSFGKAGK